MKIKPQTKKVGDVLNRMHVALPAHVDPSRPPVLPPNLIEVRKAKEMGYKRKTEKEVQEEMGGAGVYSVSPIMEASCQAIFIQFSHTYPVFRGLVL